MATILERLRVAADVGFGAHPVNRNSFLHAPHLRPANAKSFFFVPRWRVYLAVTAAAAASGEERADTMNQDDFRRMLATPKVRSGAPAVSSGGTEPDESRDKKKRKFYKPKPKPSATAKLDEAKPAYRDRAAERRQQGDEDPAPFADVAPELTVFLGGDAEHTHLVKVSGGRAFARVHPHTWGQGLDVALYEKAKADQERALDAAPSDEVAASRPADVDSLAYRIELIVAEDVYPKPVSAAAALFRPGRMAFTYNIANKGVSLVVGFLLLLFDDFARSRVTDHICSRCSGCVGSAAQECRCGAPLHHR